MNDAMIDRTGDAAPPREQGSAMEVANPEPAREEQQNGTEGNVIGSAHLLPVFLGNLDYNCTQEDLEDLFHRPIVRNVPAMPVDRVDLKRGFAFVFMQEARSEEDKDRLNKYVSDINGMDITRVSRQLRSEFARGDGRIRRKEEDRRRNITPCETLFVVNFSAETTKREDLEMLFQEFGEIVRIDMKKNYAFVQFTKVEDATRAKDQTNGGRLDQSVITVEYVAQRHDKREYRDRRGGRGGRNSPARGGRFRSRSPPRDRYDYRDRGYDRRGGGRDRSPAPRDRYDDYRRGGGGRSRSRSPVYNRYRSRSRSPGRDNRRSDRDYRDAGRGGGGRSADRDYRDNRGYK